MLRQIVGEEGDGNTTKFFTEEFSEFKEFLVLACMIESVKESNANVEVDCSSGLSKCEVGVFLVDDGVAMHSRPVVILFDVFGEEDFIDIEKHSAVLLYFVELLKNTFWSSRPFLLARIVKGLNHHDFLLLNSKFTVETAKLRCCDFRVDESSVEEMCSVFEGKTTPLPEAFIADEEVDVFSLEALVDMH